MNRTNSRVATLLRLAEDAPPKVIVQAINGLLAILRKRGVALVDFEDNKREVQGFKIFTNTAYMLAVRPRPTEGKTNGEHHHE